mgnify:FL=1|jgi:hypothetical protein|tara:strand:- start:433 stop:621 length:189 start_codon:yes stop_codon:yes gene_type:complete
MNIFKRLYNWTAVEIQMIYEDFKEGYVKTDEDLLDLLVIGSMVAAMTILVMYFIGEVGDRAL